MPSVNTKQVPREALRFSGVCKFGSNGPDAKTAPVEMLARSGQPIEHWFWGNVVHDLAGMKLTKPRIPIDYAHEDDEVLGYLNKFDTTSGDLICSGALTPFDSKDRASEVMFKAEAGVPYECSINFGGDGIRCEEIAPGQVTQVNGYQFEGPGIVIRQWPLRGVAICPYGADSNTSTNFSEASEKVAVTLFKESPMTGTAPGAANPAANVPTSPAPVAEANPAVDPTKLAANPAEAAPAAVDPGTPAEAAPAAVEAKPQDAFVTAFGDKGARWFLEGKTFAAAATDFIGEMKTAHAAEVTALNAKVADLETKLAASKMGNDPVKLGGTAEQTPQEKAEAKLANVLPAGTAKFAAHIKLPGAAA